LVVVLLFAAKLSVPPTFLIKLPSSPTPVLMGIWTPYICSITGLVSGMLVAGFT
jgi:hypothetical protein